MLAFFGPIPPLLILQEGLRLSDRSWALCSSGGELAGILGTQPVQEHPELGWVWMVATPTLTAHSVEFLRSCRPALPEIFGNYETLFNYTDARNALHHRWLRWLGFSFLRRVEQYGAEGLPFIEFAKIRPRTEACVLPS